MKKKRSLDDYYEAYAQDVYRYLLFLSKDVETVKDCLQETFFRAYLHVEELSDEKVKPWLFRVARNVWIDYKRKNSRVHPYDGIFDQEDTKALLPIDALLVKERLQTTLTHIEQLSDQQKQAIVLVGIHELSQAEAASVLGISPGHLRIVLFRARKALRQKEREIEDG
ncbi:sigma-70 family RNA polymerase sigma factor [Pontibacillus salipaludis]|uniref:sigma-70 family RNA polymerase sigma factor n=1 Tax=Pontibacillus salipaludis TaxID=1697394 RepID=UPI0031F0F435